MPSSASASYWRSRSTPTITRLLFDSIQWDRKSCSPDSRSWNLRRGGSRTALHRRRIGRCLVRILFLLRQLGDAHDVVAFFHPDQPDALRGAADCADVAGLHAQDHALLQDQQHFVVAMDVRDADDLPVAIRRLDVDDADAAA